MIDILYTVLVSIIQYSSRGIYIKAVKSKRNSTAFVISFFMAMFFNNNNNINNLCGAVSGHAATRAPCNS